MCRAEACPRPGVGSRPAWVCLPTGVGSRPIDDFAIRRNAFTALPFSRNARCRTAMSNFVLFVLFVDKNISRNTRCRRLPTPSWEAVVSSDTHARQGTSPCPTGLDFVRIWVCGCRGFLRQGTRDIGPRRHRFTGEQNFISMKCMESVLHYAVHKLPIRISIQAL